MRTFTTIAICLLLLGTAGVLAASAMDSGSAALPHRSAGPRHDSTVDDRSSKAPVKPSGKPSGKSSGKWAGPSSGKSSGRSSGKSSSKNSSKHSGRRSNKSSGKRSDKS